jgi:REP element-mobilizing transposase RayT
METMPYHVHIFLSAPPTVAPTEIVRTIKSITANRIFSVIPSLKKRYFWGSGLWSRGYYIGTAGNVSAETIKKYIEAQKSSRKEVKR